LVAAEVERMVSDGLMEGVEKQGIEGESKIITADLIEYTVGQKVKKK